MSLRDLIEAKQRRTAVLPVLVGDLAAASEAVVDAGRALQRHLAAREPAEDGGEAPQVTDADRADEAALRASVDAALEAQRQAIVYVELQALDDDEWDAVLGPIEPDEAGELDLQELHAALLAASCVDESIRDVAWWESQLARPEWTKGDKLAITNVLLTLNMRVPVGPPGKG